MSRTSLAVLVAFGVLGGSAATCFAQERELTGLYVCEGVNPDGKPYQGIVEIQKNHDTFMLTWRFAPGGGAVGFGIRSGEVLAVSYYGGIAGLVVYNIEQSARLVGRWTAAGADGAIFTETLTKLRIDLHDPSQLRPGGVEAPSAPLVDTMRASWSPIW